MIKDKNAQFAILSVFPSVETLQVFEKNYDNRRIVDSFVAFAFKEGVIQQADRFALMAFVQKKSKKITPASLPDDLSFEELFRQKKEILEIAISGRALTERVNALIAKHHIDLPKLTNTMLTRLKKEPADTSHKRNALRSLAFWLGYERSNLEEAWTFESLLKLCRAARPIRRISEGTRIGLTLYSRGDVIGQEAVAWLKKNIKKYIQAAINILPYGGWGRVKSYDITTIYIDFPKEGEQNYPASYRRSIRNAISVAHQIAVRWALSDHCTPNRFLSIGIATGPFANLNNHLLPVLNAKIPGDPVIRVTDYTHQCLLISDMRTVFCQQPKEITLFNGESLNTWWVVGLWSAIYWDFIPGLLEDETLQNRSAAVKRLNRFFMAPDLFKDRIAPNAVARFFSMPQNALLGIEIAKTLYYRRSFAEASEILKMVLSIDPVNVNARSLRMMIARCQAIEAPSHSIARIQFQMALTEAALIEENCNTLEEDFFCEYALIHFSQAITTLMRLRSKEISCDGPEKELLKSELLEQLERSRVLFSKGLQVSPTGYRSVYLLLCAKVLKIILETKQSLLNGTDEPVSLQKDLYGQASEDLIVSLNHMGWYTAGEVDFNLLEEVLEETKGQHYESVTLRAYRPTLHFCFAVMLWDFFPIRTVNIVKKVLKYLNDALPMIEALKQDNLYIYSFTRSCGEMMEPEVFEAHIRKTLRMVGEFCGSPDRLEDMEPSSTIENPDMDFTMFSIHI